MTVTRADFPGLYDKFRSTVYSVILTRVKNVEDASDLMQEVFVRFLKCDTVFTSEEHMKAWLIRVSVNLSINFLRERSHISDEELPEDIPYYDRIEDNVLVKAVAKLPDEYSTVIHLFYYEDYSTEEIARVLDLKESTVRVRLSRGREKLKKLLKEEHYEDL